MPLKSKIKLIWGAAFLASVFLLGQSSLAASTSTLRGLAWFGKTDNIDNYLSFDCADDIIGDLLDDEENFDNYPEPRGFHFYAVPCTTLVHGVSISPQGNFVGDAWHNSLGLVSFDGSDTPPDGYAFNTNCPSTCNAGNNCWACYSTSTQEVYGWAKVDGSGEWIRLHPATTTPVMLQNWDMDYPVFPSSGNILPGDFVGYATSTSGLNFSFNCESENGGSACATRNYKVYVSNVQAGFMSAPNWNYANACSSGALKAILRWRVRSGEQAGYEIVVNDTNSFSTSTSDYVCWSGIIYSPALQYTIPNSNPNCSSLSYGTNYYWWLRLFSYDDGVYTPSEWYQLGSDIESEINDVPLDLDPLTFSTYKHSFPSPFFSWSPFEPKIGSSTDFTSVGSHYYSSGNVQNDCNGSCSYLWSTSDGYASISATTSATTSIIFSTATSTIVSLSVTDPDSYVCSSSTVLVINFGLPIWREVKPEDR